MQPLRTILVIDDDPDVLESTTMLVELHFGPTATIVGATDGIQGLARALAVRPDLIISDYAMPRMDGRAFIEHARRDPSLSRIPVVLYSGTPSLPRLAAEAGADACVAKAAHVDSLIHAVDRLLGAEPHLPSNSWNGSAAASLR